MAENTSIEWTDHTWSPVWGCTQVSLAKTGGGGCDNCYAMTLAHRFGHGWNGEPMREFGEHHWNEPLRWNARAAKAGKRLKVFPSMCDPFDKDWPVGVRERFFRLILDTPHLTWLLLTKRIGNVPKMLDANQWEHLTNVWLGATVVNQEEADRDIPKLLATPARVRFLSIEPMLGPINLGASLWECCEQWEYCDYGCYGARPECCGTPVARDLLDWVIAGGESGPQARPAHPDWFRNLRDQCTAAGVPFLFKQHGEWIGVPDLRNLPGGTGPGFGSFDSCRFDEAHEAVRVGKKAAGRLLDGAQHDGFPMFEPT